MESTESPSEAAPPICPQCQNGFLTEGRCGNCRYRSAAAQGPSAGVKVQGALAALLYLASGTSLFFAFVIFTVAKSAVHEIQAMICLLIAAVCFSGAAVVTVSRPKD